MSFPSVSGKLLQLRLWAVYIHLPTRRIHRAPGSRNNSVAPDEDFNLHHFEFGWTVGKAGYEVGVSVHDPSDVRCLFEPHYKPGSRSGRILRGNVLACRRSGSCCVRYKRTMSQGGAVAFGNHTAVRWCEIYQTLTVSTRPTRKKTCPGCVMLPFLPGLSCVPVPCNNQYVSLRAGMTLKL